MSNEVNGKTEEDREEGKEETGRRRGGRMEGQRAEIFLTIVSC